MERLGKNDCLFCKITKKQLPSSVVYEDNDYLAFLDIQPVNEGHTLIIPKNHFELISEMNERSIGQLMIIGEKINRAIRKSNSNCEGVNFFLADGETAGQEIFHVHLHVIPRFKNDGFGLRFPKGYEKKPDRAVLDGVAQKIKKYLG